jgi:hypothetical protein
MPSGTYHDPDRKHLFIVCTNRCSLGKHLIVSITGWTNDLCDGTTKLSPGPGMHRFVTKESYIFYRKARIEDAAVLSKGVDDGVFVSLDPIEEACSPGSWLAFVLQNKLRAKLKSTPAANPIDHAQQKAPARRGPGLSLSYDPPIQPKHSAGVNGGYLCGFRPDVGNCCSISARILSSQDSLRSARSR